MYYDETRCATCGITLPEFSPRGTWHDHGFCSSTCARRCPAGYQLLGTAAITMAETPGRNGGPGFERAIVRDWLKHHRPNAPAMLSRISGDADLDASHAGSWSWRLWSGGVCRAHRLTPKEAADA